MSETEARVREAQRLLGEGAPDAAAGLMEELLAGEPDHLEARYALAVARRHQHRWPQALDTLGTVLAARPGFGRAHQEVGYNYIALRNLDRAGAVEVPQGDVVVPHLLVRPPEPRTGREDGAERVQRLGPPVLVPPGDGQRVPRLEMVRLAGEQLFHEPRGRVRRALAEQALRLANPGFRLRQRRPRATYPSNGPCLHRPRVAKQLRNA